MHAFIVRPFGSKEGIDFDRVEEVLIAPALAAAGIEGGTTAEIAQAGNIREDMFRLLVTADLIVADLSIHNANVFYELGIRHGLRPRGTLLIRADVDAYPFDLQTDRFLLYDAKDPAATLGKLTEAVIATRAAQGIDSPVYKMLPRLPAPSPTVLRAVPQDFAEAVEAARAEQHFGDLRLLAHETDGLEWASEGLRTVGLAQFSLKRWPGARETFESLRQLAPDDLEANQRLGTIYQKMGDFTRSTQAIQRVIDSSESRPRDRAEAFALQGSNAKTRWRQQIEAVPPDAIRLTALRRPELQESILRYTAGFAQDLNHFYSGLNALGLLRIRNDLAEALPDVWGEAFESDDEARRAKSDSDALFEHLKGAVQLSIQARRTFLDRQQSPDAEEVMWAAISEADHGFLVASTARAVRRKYALALAGATPFGRAAVRAQLEIFDRLGVRADFVREGLAAVDDSEKTSGAAAPVPGAQPDRTARVLLFTGHMVDAPDRKTPRFPPTPGAEAEARRLIRASVEGEQHLEPGSIVGIAGGACGGDILFHEICQELGIETRLFLALPPAEFSAISVQQGGKSWVERFNVLWRRLVPRVLAEREELPAWLRGRKGYNIWQRNNLWMLFNALAIDARSLTLIALWDDGPSDGPGGTSDLVRQVTTRGHKVDRLPAERLKDLAAI